MLIMTPRLPVSVYRIYKRNCARMCAYVFYSSKSCKINSLTDRIFSRRDKKKRRDHYLFAFCMRPNILYNGLHSAFNQSPVRPKEAKKSYNLCFHSSCTFIIVRLLASLLPKPSAHAYTFLISHKAFFCINFHSIIYSIFTKTQFTMYVLLPRIHDDQCPRGRQTHTAYHTPIWFHITQPKKLTFLISFLDMIWIGFKKWK